MAEPININFRWASNAQKPSAGATQRQVKAVTDRFVRVLVNEVALAASDKTYQSARRELETSLTRLLEAEVTRMAKLIGSRFIVQDTYAGPNGDLSLDRSQTAAKTPGFKSYFSINSAGIKWAKRNRVYLRQKEAKGEGGNWWKKTGSLQRFLKSKSGKYYERAFGPVRVYFRKNRSGSWDNEKVTSSGMRGQLSKTVTVGRLDVLAFGKITPKMMPGLQTMSPESNPQPGPGVASLLPVNHQVVKLLQKSSGKVEFSEKAPRGVLDRFFQSGRRKKLKGQTRPREYRPAIDPFVSFYLTRAVPNAVWRRVEQFVEKGVKIGNSSGKGYEV